MNARSAQIVAAMLAFLLIILVGALIFFLLSRPAQGPRATPSASPTTAAVGSASPLPSLSPSVSPTASLSPTFSQEPFPSPTVIVTPEITPEITPTIPPTPTPPPPPTPTPAPTPEPVPISPPRQIRMTNMGLDARNETGIERYLVFGVDGPSIIRAQISNATGRVRVCLWQEGLEEDPQCDRMGNGVLEHAVFDAGSTNWTLTLISANATTNPTADLALDFNANAPSVALENFRFQGGPVASYNGFTTAVDALGTGEVRITGTFDVGQQHSYRVVIAEAGVGVVKDETGGPTNSFVVTHPVTAITSYRVVVSNPNTGGEPAAVFLSSTFSWP